jgi:hypothetical protein
VGREQFFALGFCTTPPHYVVCFPLRFRHCIVGSLIVFCMSWLVSLLRLNPNVRGVFATPKRNISVKAIRASVIDTPPRPAAAFVTLANHRPHPSAPASASPTNPATVNKICSRTQLLAGHLHPTTTTRTATTMAAKSQYTARRVGAAHTLEHRIFIEKDGQLVSPFHDIPLYANEQQTVLNMVVEVRFKTLSIARL